MKKRLFPIIALTPATLCLFASPAQAAEREFSLRYSANGWINVEQAGNVMLTCPTTDRRCGMDNVNNNIFDMVYVDVDGDPSTFNSSTARVFVPPGARVDEALLYWGGDTGEVTGATPLCSAPGAAVTPAPNPAQANQVMVKVGSAASYVPVTAAAFDFAGPTNGKPFQGRADISALFDPYNTPGALTPVDITVANLQTAQGRNCSGGWTIVLVYMYPAGPDPLVSPNPTYAPAYRNVSVFDGFVAVASTSNEREITLSGFLTAPDGSVDGRIGAVSYEGDRNTDGDFLAINDTKLPITDNFFNSTVQGSSYGATIPGVGQVAPVYNNNLGYDSKTVPVPDGVIPNGSTSVTASFDTDGDAYQLGAFIFTARIEPMADITKTVTRDGQPVADGVVVAGDRLTFTITVRNIGDLEWDSASITDLVPDGLTLVPGEDPNLDLGVVAPGETRTHTFDVTVDKDAPDSVTIVNRADLEFNVDGNGFVNTARADIIPRWPDLALAKSVTPASTAVPGEVDYTITLTNQSAIPATGIEVTDGLPAGVTVLSSTPSQGTYSGGTWTAGSLAGNGTATLTLRARVDLAQALRNVAEISAADQNDLDSMPGNGAPGEDDIADATVTGLNATTITTAVAAPAVPIGDPVSDMAVVTGGGADPTGTVTFSLFGPDDAQCTGTPAFTATQPLTGGTADSGPFTPAAPGAYRWVTVYGGDATHVPAASPCNSPNETVVVNPPDVPSQPGQPQDGPSLPETGEPTRWLTAGGVGMVLLGLLGVRLTRRRVR